MASPFLRLSARQVLLPISGLLRSGARIVLVGEADERFTGTGLRSCLRPKPLAD
jgi:hypothetical protein